MMHSTHEGIAIMFFFFYSKFNYEFGQNAM
jgi:hypothetical protein